MSALTKQGDWKPQPLGASASILVTVYALLALKDEKLYRVEMADQHIPDISGPFFP